MKDKLIEIQKKHAYLAKRSWLLYWDTVAAEALELIRLNCSLCDPALPEIEQRLSIDERPCVEDVESEIESASEPDIRMRVWIPYSLKRGLVTVLVQHEDPIEKAEWVLPFNSSWVEFVAVNDPLVKKPEPQHPCPECGEEMEYWYAIPRMSKGRECPNGEECIS